MELLVRITIGACSSRSDHRQWSDISNRTNLGVSTACLERVLLPMACAVPSRRGFKIIGAADLGHTSCGLRRGRQFYLGESEPARQSTWMTALDAGEALNPAAVWPATRALARLTTPTLMPSSEAPDRQRQYSLVQPLRWTPTFTQMLRFRPWR